MFNFLQNAQGIRRLLWVIVAVGVAASLLLAFERLRTEQSSKKVEIVFDYRDLLDIADLKTKPKDFVNQQLDLMKKAKITSLSVYESTLVELRESRRVELYNSRDAAALTQTPVSPTENFAYVLFPDPTTQDTVRIMIENAFRSIGVNTRSWSFKNQQGIVIEMPLEEANLKPLGHDPITLKLLQDKGFHIVGRLSNRKAFNPQEMDAILTLLESYGVKTIIPDGEAVPGYANTKGKTVSLEQMGALLKKHRMALATVELQKAPPKGFITLAQETDFNVLRLHSFAEAEADKLAQNLNKEERDSRIQAVADRFVLAVKDRNIRMIMLNARPLKNIEKGTFTDPLDPIYQTLDGQDGAIPRIEAAGFTIGQAHAFDHHQSSIQKLLKPLVVIGSVAMIALMAAYFFPALGLPILLLGSVGALGLMVVSAEALYKVLALATAVSAATVAMISGIRMLRFMAAQEGGSIVNSALYVVIRSTLISLLGGAFVVGLLNNIMYNLLLDQFKGVKVLAYLPIVLVLIYLLFFSVPMTGAERMGKVQHILLSKISVLWIITAGVVLGAGYYYLSRTGNEGQASGFEMYFRSFLENTLKVRPRTKELLIGHPLFLLGAYLCMKKRIEYLYIVLIGAIAQADVVGTFTHLHTPLLISSIRVVYGLVFGVMIGLVAIAVWEIIAKGWSRWIPKPSGS